MLYEFTQPGIRKGGTKAASGRGLSYFNYGSALKESLLMIIECKNCSRRFNLNENLLKPTGSRLRCSKCGNIFHAYPARNDGSLNPTLAIGGIAQNAEKSESAFASPDKRKNPRVPVSIPVLCDALDLEGNPHDIYAGAIKEVSQTGLAIELFSRPASEQVSLSFINGEDRDVQIKAKVVHSRINSFKTRIGLSLAGSAAEVEHFVSQVMQTHHSVNSVARQARIAGIRKGEYPLTS